MEGILLKRRAVFFNNLILLGLDCSHFEKKSGISFHKDMFVTPNKKGFEAVTYFLFTKLSAVTQKDYKLPWPLITKELDRIFQKTCYAHLNSFSQENIVKFPRIVPSSLSTFGGDRFYEVYLAFSSHVLCKTMKKEVVLSRPSVDRNNFSVAQNILELSTIAHLQAIQQTQYLTQSNHFAFVQLAKNLSECLENLKKLLKSDEELKVKDSNTLRSLLGFCPDEKLNSKKIIARIYEFYKPTVRKTLEKFFSTEAELWRHLASEIGKNRASHVLDGQVFNISLSESLPTDLYSEIERTGIITVKEDGKLSVLKFLKLLQAYLKFITMFLIKADLSRLHEACSVEDATTIEDNLNYIENLLKRLHGNEIPDMMGRITVLKSETCFNEPNINSNCASIPLQSFDPDSVRERVPHFDPGELFQFSSPNVKKLDEIKDSSFDLENFCCDKLSNVNIVHPSVSICDDISSFKTYPCREITVSEKTFLNELLNEEILLPDSVLRKTKLAAQGNIPTTAEINLALDEDFEYSSKFPMQNSSLLEQSLHSVTNPNISFDD